MYQIQADKLAYFNKQIGSHTRKITYRLTLNDQPLHIDKVMDNLTLTTDSGLEQYGVGSALVAQLQMSVKKEVMILPKDKIKVEIGLEIFNEVSQQWETIYSPLGVFFVDTIEETGIIKKLKAYDGMYKLNKGYFPSSKHTTTQAIANDIAQANGYRVTGVINVGINNEQLEGKNCNEMLSLVASAMGRNVRISRDGSAIEFIEPIATNLTFNENNLSTATLDDSTTYNITKLRVNYSDKATNDKGEVTDEGYYTVGSGGDANTLELNNPLLKGQKSQATNVLNIIKKLNGYKRFDTTMPLADFRIEPMDLVTYSKGGVNYLVPILYSKMVLSYQGISIETQSPTLAPTKSEFSFKGTLTQKVENMYTDIIQVKQLTANKVTTDELEATVATIEKLYATKAEIGELVAGTIIVEELKAQIAEIDRLVANKADINQLTALNATINSLKAQVAEIDNLIAGSILSQIIQSGSISSDLLNVKDGFIKDAMISSLSASKINSGVINTNNVLITSDNGNMTLQGNLLQFKDKSGKVRIQIGQDTQGNYTFTLYDSTGKGVLINEQGIQSSNAIKDGLIVDSKVAGNANISGSKLNISSLYDSMNADGSKTLKASKVHLDDKGQTLDVSFKEMTTKQDSMENTMNTAITDISVSKGQISQLIQDTTITTANGTTTLKDAYNSTKSTVDSHTTSIGNMQSTINSHTGEIESVKNQTAEMKVDLGKIELGLSSLDTTVKNDYYTKKGTDSAIKLATDEITQSVSTTYETKTEVTNKVNTAIDGIQIGARNLLVKDALESGNLSGVDGSVIGGNYPNFYRTKNFIEIDNKSKYALKLNKSKSGDKIEKIVAYASNNTYISTHEINSMETVFTPPINCQKIKFVVVINSTSASTIVYDSKIMLEKGTKPSDFTPAPEDGELQISELTTRVSKAEQKITDDAIIQTVSQTINNAKTEAINDANNHTNNQLKNYSTTLQMNTAIQQKTDSITSEVSKIERTLAIDNLLANGNFTNGINNWEYKDFGSPVNSVITSNTDWVMKGKNALLLTATNHPQGYDSGFTQAIDVKPNTDYTFTGYVASHRAEGMVIVKDDAGNWLVYDKTDPNSDTYPGTDDIAKWKRVRIVYHSGNRTKLYLHLALAKSNDNGHVWFHDFMVHEGDMDLCWKPSERETRAKVEILNDRITSTVTDVTNLDGRVNRAESQITQQANQIASKVNTSDFASLIQQNGHNIMFGINSAQSSMGVKIDSNGLTGLNNNIMTFLLTQGKMHVYNSITGQHMGYFGTFSNDLRANLTGTNTFSVMHNDSTILIRGQYNRDSSYGNCTIDLCGGINFIHKPGVSTGLNQILLGNHDVSDQYGYHNIAMRVWNSMGFADNLGLTNMFLDARRGRWIMKGAVYQNAQTPPRMFSMSFDEDDEVYRSGFTRKQAVDSIMRLKTGVYVDNDGECCTALYGGHDELITTEYTDEDGITSTHINTSALNASLVVTCQEQQKLIEALQKELNEIKKYLKVG